MVMLAIYVCMPALIAALLFRGGLVLRMAGMTFVRRDGKRASRLRVFWRALVAWSPLWLALFGFILMSGEPEPRCVNGFAVRAVLRCCIAGWRSSPWLCRSAACRTVSPEPGPCRGSQNRTTEAPTMKTQPMKTSTVNGGR